MPTTIASGRRIANAGAWEARAGGGLPFEPARTVLLNTTTGKIEVWKSLDGATYTEQDSAHEPTAVSTTASYSTWPTSAFIYVVYFTATNTINVRRFDKSTDLWETSDLGTGSAGTTAINTRSVRVVVRSNGDVIVGYQTSTNTILYSRRVGTTWTTAVLVSAAASNRLQDMLIDDADVTYFLYGDDTNNDNSARTLSAANALGTEGDADTTAHTTAKPFSVMGEYFTDGTNKKIIWPGRDSTGEFDAYHQNQGTAIAVTTVASIATSTTPQTTNVAINGFHNALHFCWAEANTVMRNKTASFSSFTLSGVVTVLSGLADADVCPQWGNALAGQGVLYQESGAVKIDWTSQPYPLASSAYPVSSSSVNSAAVTANTNINLPKPPDWTPAVNDYVIAIVGSRATVDSTFTVAGGDGTWGECTHAFKSGSGPSLAIWSKRIATAGSEPTNYTYQFNQSAQTFAALGVFRNVATSSEIDVTGTPQTGSTATATQSATTTLANDVAVFATGYGASTSTTKSSDPTGYTNYQHNTSQMRGSLDAALIATAGSTSPTETNSGPDNWATLLIALAAPSAASTPITGTDSSAITGTDASAVALVGTVTDTSAITGSDTSAIAIVGIVTDTGAVVGSDTSAVLLRSTVTDTSAITGTDSSSIVIVQAVAVTDTGTVVGTDTSAVALASTVTDAGTITSTDAGTIAATLPLNDTGAILSTDAGTIAATMTLSDTGAITGTDTAAIAITATVTESGAIASTDASSITSVNALSVSDTGTIVGTDASALMTIDTKAVTDTGTIAGADTASLITTNAKTGSDTGAVTGSDTASVVVLLMISETGAIAASDTTSLAPKVALSDIGLLVGSDTASVFVTMTATDLGILASSETAHRGDVSLAPYEVFTAPASPGTSTIGGDGPFTATGGDTLTAPAIAGVLTGG
jgi:hypothetical protein